MTWRRRRPVRPLPGVDLPVRPSTLRIWKDLQKFDPSDYPSGGVRRAVRTLSANAVNARGLSRLRGVGCDGTGFLELGYLSEHRLVLVSIGASRFQPASQYIMGLGQLMGLKIA